MSVLWRGTNKVRAGVRMRGFYWRQFSRVKSDDDQFWGLGKILLLKTLNDQRFRIKMSSS